MLLPGAALLTYPGEYHSPQGSQWRLSVSRGRPDRDELIGCVFRHGLGSFLARSPVWWPVITDPACATGILLSLKQAHGQPTKKRLINIQIRSWV